MRGSESVEGSPARPSQAHRNFRRGGPQEGRKPGQTAHRNPACRRERYRSTDCVVAAPASIPQDETELDGEAAGTRTRDPRLKRPLLYQLSYRPASPRYLTSRKTRDSCPSTRASPGSARPGQNGRNSAKDAECPPQSSSPGRDFKRPALPRSCPAPHPVETRTADNVGSGLPSCGWASRWPRESLGHAFVDPLHRFEEGILPRPELRIVALAPQQQGRN